MTPGASARRSVSPSGASPTMRSAQPRGVFSNWRTGRASKNSLATSSIGPSGTSSRRACQVGSKSASAVRCKACSRGLMSTRWRSSAAWKPGDAARGAQCIGHQRAAAGPQLDEAHRLRPAHRQPALGEPGAQKLAEHLGDFRRRREVAGGAHRQGGAVVAEAGMAERLGHEVGDRDRAGERDASCDQLAELRGHGTGVTKQGGADMPGRSASRRRPATAATAACPW